MHFLYPAFFFALLSLAIPVLVHLFNFRRYQKVYFSNVQFLRQVNEQQSSRRNLKERLILAARLLTLTFLILAFTRPYISNQNAQDSGAQHVVSVFVDNSYSMETLNREGALLYEAKLRAREIASAYGINDKFQVLTQDFEGKHQRLLSRDEFNDAVDAIKISPQSRSLQQIINRQQSMISMQPNTLRSVYIISDFQKNVTNGQPLKTDPATHVNFVQLKASSLPNVAVDSVALLSAVHRPGESEKLIVRLHNYADAAAAKIPLKVTINGKQKALGSYTIPPRAIQTDTLIFSGLQPGWQRGEISLQDNPVTFDNRFYFSFNVKKQMPLLLIDDGTANKFLKEVFAADPFFAATRFSAGNVNYTGFSAYPVIVLSDIKSISTGLAQQLKTYVTKGGSLIVFPAKDADVNSYKNLLQPLNAAYPGKLVTGNTKVSSINLKNPVFKSIFDSFPQSPDLPVVKKYYELTGSGGENLLQLPGGKQFWMENVTGRGKAYVSAVALDDDFSNLQRHALFLPVMFRIALLSGHDQPLFYTLGHDETMEISPIQTNKKQLLKLSNGDISIIPDVRQLEGSTLLYASDELIETGIYDLRKQDSTVAVLAFNDNRSESDLSYYTKNDLSKMLPKNGTVLQSSNASIKSIIAEENIGLQLWKLCIILALVFLAAEIVLVRYFKTAKVNPQPV